ncbi:MAG TPA: DUF736 family protein [Stellaceae bacterium]|jgi:uncharacterized protein (DUF736 family)
MNIGRLVRAQEPGEFIGNITTRTLALQLVMRQSIRWKSADKNSPKYELFERSRHGEVAIGMAWEKTAHTVDNLGRKYLSLLLDDPSFDQQLQCSGFETEDGYDIVWQRPRDDRNFRPDPGRAADRRDDPEVFNRG